MQRNRSEDQRAQEIITDNRTPVEVPACPNEDDGVIVLHCINSCLCMMQESFRDKQVEWTNHHCHDVAAGDVGSKDWKGDFTRLELDKYIATDLLNGMHPYPSVRLYFQLDG